MYRLPDGEHFVFFGKWDAKTLLWGNVHDPVEDRLVIRIVQRSVLEQSALVPTKKEPWKCAEFELGGEKRRRR